MESAKIVVEAVRESLRLLGTLPDDQGMQNEATAVRLMADFHEQTGSVDLAALDRCIRRMRIAATSGKYPDNWPDDLAPSN